MKKLFFGGLIVAAAFSVIVSCSKTAKEDTPASTVSVTEYDPAYSNKEVANILADINTTEKVGPGWFAKVKKWFHDHTGTYLFQGCNNHNPCGPCPGLCLRAGIVDANDNNGDQATPADYANGFRVFGLNLLEHEETHAEEMLFIFHKDVADYTSGGFFYIENNIMANATICTSMGKTSIQFIKGKYPVVFDSTTGYYYALVTTVMT